jgi:hypothetical protein
MDQFEHTQNLGWKLVTGPLSFRTVFMDHLPIGVLHLRALNGRDGTAMPQLVVLRTRQLCTDRFPSRIALAEL